MSGHPVRIEFERSGGVAGVSMRTAVDSQKLDPARAAELEGLLGCVEGAPAGGPGGADRFQYDLKIIHGGQQTAVTLRDGSLTDQQRRLVDLLTELARHPS